MLVPELIALLVPLLSQCCDWSAVRAKATNYREVNNNISTMCFSKVRRLMLDHRQRNTRVSDAVWANIQSAGIQRPPRGKRSGCRKQRAIQAIVSNRCSAHNDTYISYENLLTTSVHRNLTQLQQVPVKTYTLPVILTANVRSLSSKVDDLQTVCEAHSVDIVTLAETWLSSAIPSEPRKLSGFDGPLRRDREDGQGRGVE